MENPIDSVRELKEQLAIVLVGEIGTYNRPPPLSPIPAIFVGDRPVPKGSKIKVADMKGDPVPAMEVIISSRPQYESIGRNVGTRLFNESWQIWLIFHDARQNPRMAIANIMANFKTAGDITYIPSSDLVPEQYTVRIKRNSQIRVNC